MCASGQTHASVDWNPVTKEFALTGGVEMLTYAASKKFAELALWEWADKHPHVEVTTCAFPSSNTSRID